ncbi:MAG TPA: hypothetical protein VHQ86_05485, partial [Candidatus Saccharimonadia bacterium]|nr:hypothetical protein [Candidatus Saccharimonadia bacterium]
MTAPEEDHDQEFAAFSREHEDLEILAVPTPNWGLARGNPAEGLTWQERQGLNTGESSDSQGHRLLRSAREALSGGLEVEQADRDAALRTAFATLQGLYSTENGRDGLARFNALAALYMRAMEATQESTPYTPMLAGDHPTPEQLQEFLTN